MTFENTNLKKTREVILVLNLTYKSAEVWTSENFHYAFKQMHGVRIKCTWVWPTAAVNKKVESMKKMQK